MDRRIGNDRDQVKDMADRARQGAERPAPEKPQPKEAPPARG